MNHTAHVVPGADPRRPLPASPVARLDGAHHALAALREEERRLVRLGLREPLRRCREQMRYWEFLAAIFALPGRPAAHDLYPHHRGH